jgi:hypothetical protein
MGVYGLRTGNHFPWGQDATNTDAVEYQYKSGKIGSKNLHVKVSPLRAAELGNSNRRRLVL